MAVSTGTIAAGDLSLFKIVDSPQEGFEYLRAGLTEFHLKPEKIKHKEEVEPEIAKTNP
jgi:hypothetical protein